MQSAILNIIDEIGNLKRNSIYKFNRISRYFNLLAEFDSIYPITKYKRFLIVFSFKYEGKNILVDDLTKFILPKDIIEIRITLPDPLYYLVDSISLEKIRSSYNIKELYKYYLEKKDEIDCEIFILKENNGKTKLIDVLIEPNYIYNQCVNRLIFKYNF